MEVAHRLAAGEPIGALTDIRGTAYVTTALPTDRVLIDSTSVDQPGADDAHPNPYDGMEPEPCSDARTRWNRAGSLASPKPDTHAIRLPSIKTVTEDPVLYAHASRVFHKETNPITPCRWCKRMATGNLAERATHPS